MTENYKIHLKNFRSCEKDIRMGKSTKNYKSLKYGTNLYGINFNLSIPTITITKQLKKRIPKILKKFKLVEFKIFATAYIIGGSLVAYQIGYVADRCSRRQFQTLISH